VVGVLAPTKVGPSTFDPDDEGLEYKDWLRYGELDDQFRFLDPTPGGRFSNFLQGRVLWRALGMRLLYTQNGLYASDEDATAELQLYLRGLFWGLSSDDFAFGLPSDEVMAMIKQVAVQAMWVNTLLRAIPCHYEITYINPGRSIRDTVGNFTYVGNNNRNNDSTVDFIVQPGLEIHSVELPQGDLSRFPDLDHIASEPSRVVAGYIKSRSKRR
jgi:hypothetical protein